MFYSDRCIVNRLLHKHRQMIKKMKAVRFVRVKDHTQHDCCPICLEAFSDNDTVKRIKCGHVFHSSCIDPWLSEISDICPVCRRPVVEMQPRNYEKELIVEISEDMTWM